ncbi:unnamed protein product [Ilex paraguariensis]|uniref:Uncharacterized protein n=1 Tax=Ilex paraguariensis TaxID=185542 RepID=A0ABC8TUY9_9AQUA
MAMCNGPTKLQVEAFQTVLPLNQTDPRQLRRVSPTKTFFPSILQRRLHSVLCYNKASEEDSGWAMAGWIKESLGLALLEQPLLAGRLRRGEGVDGGLEIVSNDCGVRLIEAKIEMDLAEVVDLKGREEVEAELVFWEDIDEENPQFSPLFYVQVTNFKCGGYSIGISCSLLLADPLFMASFFKSWASIHRALISKTDTLKKPIFYLPNLRKTGCSPTTQNCSIPSKNRGQSLIFKMAETNLNLDTEMQKTLAMLCIEAAESHLGTKMAMKFSVFVREPSGAIKVENCLERGLVQKPLSIVSQLTDGNWDDLGADEVCFNEENKPACVSYWINSFSDEGLVMVIPSPKDGGSGTRIIVTTPMENVV